MPARKSVKKPVPKKISRGRMMLRPKLRFNKFAAVILILIFAGVGSYLLFYGRAAAPNFDKGVVSDITWGASNADVDRTVAQLQDAGVKWVRANIAWTSGEPVTKGQFHAGNFSQYDYAISKARAAGINVLIPVADGVPCWASGDPNKNCSTGTWSKLYHPANYQDYADFMVYVVNRYKTMGVHSFEVWNEPNHSYFWPSGVDASEYVKMLKATYPAIKQTDPNSVVLMGGLSKNDYNYLQQLYAAGGGAYFDIANVHPYTGSVDPTVCWNQSGTNKKALDAFCGIEEVRATMTANGDSAKEMWLTEFGWSTCACAYGVSEVQQADYLNKAFAKLETYTYVKKAFLYNFRNEYWSNDNVASWNANTGLMRVNYSQKPAYDAYKSYGAGIAASDTTAPVVKITSPVQGSTVGRNVNVNATATDNVKVTKMEVYIDGRLKTSNTNSTSISYAWYTRKVAAGSHTITVKAYDAVGNIGQGSVMVNI